jgi:serine/threonine protein kinase
MYDEAEPAYSGRHASQLWHPCRRAHVEADAQKLQSKLRRLGRRPRCAQPKYAPPPHPSASTPCSQPGARGPAASSPTPRRRITMGSREPAGPRARVLGSPALTDFGVARCVAFTVLTRPGRVLGTLDYPAPELVRGGKATPASDVYALGCVAFECLAGKPPFVGPEPVRHRPGARRGRSTRAARCAGAFLGAPARARE